MADNKELKPKSFRIDDETADKFKELSGQIGGNQQETLAKLIEAYEFQAGKAILTEKKSDIEQFEKYVNALTRMFMGSLEDNQNITETVRTSFDAQLKSKDTTIQDLQENITVAKQLKEEATSKAKSLTDENLRLNTLIDSMTKEYDAKMKDMQEALDDKTDLTNTLKESCHDLKVRVDSMQHEHDQFITVSSELENLKRKQSQLEKNKSDLQTQLDNENMAHGKAIAAQQQHELEALEHLKEHSQLILDKALLELEKKQQVQIEKLKAQIEQIKEQKQAEIDKYQQKYFELLEQIKNQSNNKEIKK